MNEVEFRRTLLDTATAPYKPAGKFAWHFARGKLGRDPAFMFLLARGLLDRNTKTILDLGCGQGLLAAWLIAAIELHRRGQWPVSWPVPPREPHCIGIELMQSDVTRAQVALGGNAAFICGDICNTPFPSADAIVILDVLHYVDYAKQNEVLERVRAALNPRGQLLLRVGDAAAGLPFKISNWVDHVVTFARGHRLLSLYCRTLNEWRTQLENLGFRVDAVPMSAGTPFANILLVAKADS